MPRVRSFQTSKDQTLQTKIIEQDLRTNINTCRAMANQRTTAERPCDSTANFSPGTYLDLLTVLLFSLIWVGMIARLRLKKSLPYLIFFTIFYIYMIMVLDYTLFQFQSLILLKHFMPNLILNGQTAGQEINLIPFMTLTSQDLTTSLLNILLLIPFGFGLPFITDIRMKTTVVIGALLSIGIELLQLITGFMAKMTFRIADINDVIFNTAGVAFGYVLFVGFVRLYRRIFHNWQISANPILQYVAERPQVDR